MTVALQKFIFQTKSIISQTFTNEIYFLYALMFSIFILGCLCYKWYALRLTWRLDREWSSVHVDSTVAIEVTSRTILIVNQRKMRPYKPVSLIKDGRVHLQGMVLYLLWIIMGVCMLKAYEFKSALDRIDLRPWSFWNVKPTFPSEVFKCWVV